MSFRAKVTRPTREFVWSTPRSHIVYTTECAAGTGAAGLNRRSNRSQKGTEKEAKHGVRLACAETLESVLCAHVQHPEGCPSAASSLFLSISFLNARTREQHVEKVLIRSRERERESRSHDDTIYESRTAGSSRATPTQRHDCAHRYCPTLCSELSEHRLRRLLVLLMNVSPPRLRSVRNESEVLHTSRSRTFHQRHRQL